MSDRSAGGSIVVVEYDPAWPLEFERIRAQLHVALADVPVEGIEHVGSTSVPGLAAKPIIDIDVIVVGEHVPAAIAAVVAAGYEYLGDLGIPDRHAFRAPTGATRQNLYVTVQGCLSLRNHLGVRDVLRSDSALRDEYGSLKFQLAGDHDDIDQYTSGKTAVLQRILRAAGLDQDELDELDELNRA